MQTAFENQKIELDEGVDIGYSVEKITLRLSDETSLSLPRRGVTTLLMSAPILDGALLTQLAELDIEFCDKSVEDFEAIFVLSEGQELPSGFKFLKFATDKDCEYSDEFGTKIHSGRLNGKLAKALFVISRDYVLFHKEICTNIEDKFSIDRLYFQLGKALNVYNGAGCH